MGIDPWFTRKLSIESVFVLENDVDAWLRLRSPLVNVSLSDSCLGNAGKLVEFLTRPDVARVDFPPVATNRCRLICVSAPSPEDFPGTGNSYGPAAPVIDWRDAIVLTERPPDRIELETVFSKHLRGE